MDDQIDVVNLQRFLTDEVIRAMGLSQSGWHRRWLAPIFDRATRRFATLAAGFDDVVARKGFRAACQWVLPSFVDGFDAHGAEGIPEEGPLLVISNHPGTYDSLVIAASLPREDLKIIAAGVPFLCGLPFTGRYLIHCTLDLYNRMSVLRAALRHLHVGGALLIFGSGTIDPDPSVLPGAEQALETWSPSLEWIMRKAPQAQVLLSVVSGVLAARWVHNPFIRLRHGTRERQRLAEFFQVAQQMIFPHSLRLRPRISFGQVFTVDALSQRSNALGMLGNLVEEARGLLHAHVIQESPEAG